MRILFLFFLTVPHFLWSQCYNRYSQEIFSNTQSTKDIVYGVAVDYKGDTINLELDYYEPQADPIEKRPLIVLLHGPDFVNGSKEDTTLVLFAEKLVRRGYAVATVNYRKAFSLQTILDKDNLFRANLQAAQDAKAAIRYFKKELHQNTYAFDSTMIWLGGIGAGSMAAQMAVYLDDTLEVSPSWRVIIEEEGGLEGNSGHPFFSSKVKGVINLSGAIIDSAWISNNTEALINIHGELDDYYPYFSDSLFAYTHNNICNGHHELYYKRLNEATFVQTHNSHAHDGDFSVLAANQNGDIPAQFAAGVRGLGIKLYYTSSFFCGSGTKLYVYHGDPIFGCIEFSTIGGQILDFLNNNPNEFLFVTVEGSASNTEIANGFNSSGLTPFLYQHNLGAIWPTLGELIESGKRLIVMTSNSGASLPGYHHMWSFIQDTEYDFQNTGAFNCNHLRGNSNADLFLLNHFLTVASPQPLSAPSTNAWDLVLNRARQCGQSRGLHPNLLYIDFFDSGDVFRAADSLNRIGDDFPAVYGSYNIHHHALQNNILSELFTIQAQGYAPYSNLHGDSTANFISDFMIRHYPCAMSCATPVDLIQGQDSIWKDSSYTYTISNNQGATYQWIVSDSIFYSSTNINVSASDTSNFLTISLIETSQYGCVYDTVKKQVPVFINTNIQKLEIQNTISIRPNPASEYIEVYLKPFFQDDCVIEIYDQQGKLIIQNRNMAFSYPFNINTSKLIEGIYILKIKQKNQLYFGKFKKID